MLPRAALLGINLRKKYQIINYVFYLFSETGENPDQNQELKAKKPNFWKSWKNDDWYFWTRARTIAARIPQPDSRVLLAVMSHLNPDLNPETGVQTRAVEVHLDAGKAEALVTNSRYS